MLQKFIFTFFLCAQQGTHSLFGSALSATELAEVTIVRALNFFIPRDVVGALHEGEDQVPLVLVRQELLLLVLAP